MTGSRRRQERCDCEIRVEYRTVGSFLSDWTSNLSRGGMFLRSDTPLRPGSQLRLVFSLPGLPVLFDVLGQVRWVEEGRPGRERGMGIEFLRLDERIRDRIERFLDRHRTGQQPVQEPASSRPQVDEITQPRIVVSKPGRRDKPED